MKKIDRNFLQKFEDALEKLKYTLPVGEYGRCERQRFVDLFSLNLSMRTFKLKIGKASSYKNPEPAKPKIYYVLFIPFTYSMDGIPTGKNAGFSYNNSWNGYSFRLEFLNERGGICRVKLGA